jgi:hypothetical protein
MLWNHHTTAGAFRLAKVALRVLQEKGALGAGLIRPLEFERRRVARKSDSY